MKTIQKRNVGKGFNLLTIEPLKLFGKGRPDSLRSVLRCFGLGLIVIGSTSPAATCVPPPAGLVSWWQAQSNALDSVGTNHATLINGAGFAAGEIGSCPPNFLARSNNSFAGPVFFPIIKVEWYKVK